MHNPLAVLAFVTALTGFSLVDPAPQLLEYARLKEDVIEFAERAETGTDEKVLGSWRLENGREPMAVALSGAGAAFAAIFEPDGAVRLRKFAYRDAKESGVGDRRFERIEGIALSPDGRTLAFGMEGESGLRLGLCASDGSSYREAGPAGHGAFPAFDPSGRRVAYESWVQDPRNPDKPQSTLWVLALSSGEPKRITPFGLPARTPVWSPDGLRVLYAVPGMASLDLRTVGADGIGAKPFVRDAPSDLSARPFFARDGSAWSWRDGEGFFRAGSDGPPFERRIDEIEPILAARWKDQ